MDNFCDYDAMRHRKRKEQKSKSNKRSNHKHDYEKIIIKSIIGWQWAEQCKICGRIKCKFAVSYKEFVRPECRQLPYASRQTYYTYEELLELYPDTKIIDKFEWELN